MISHKQYYRPRVILAFLLATLTISSVVMIYITAQNIQTAKNLSIHALDSIASSLSMAVEQSLRESGGTADSKIKEVFSDRVVAYALIVNREGLILFHTNPNLVGLQIDDPKIKQWFDKDIKQMGRRITLQTGLPAYEYNYPVHLPDGTPEVVRIVLHTTPVDKILLQTKRLWLTVGMILTLLWASGLLSGFMLMRHLRVQKELEDKKQLALIGQMAAVLSHEIRNALGGIKGYAQWLDEKIKAEDQKKKGLAMILKGTDRIERLVNELLMYSKKEEYKIEDVNILNLVEEVVNNLCSNWKGEVYFDIEKDFEAKADKEKLYRVLTNVVQNALHAMGDVGKLLLSAHWERGYAKIEIKDTGTGISESDLGKLFTPFYTTKVDGTGLGLSYSKKVIEGMGGRIELSNRRDEKGAVLTIFLSKKEGR